MAKETKAQRQEREAAETAKVVEWAKTTYTERMMAVFNRAVKMNFEMTVDATSFLLADRDERRPTTFHVSPTWDGMADCDLHLLEQAVEWKEDEAQERERVRNMREAALAKLTPEERELLKL